MGLLKKLFGTAAVAGTAIAASKVVDKVKENNPDGIQDTNGDGKVDANDYVAEYTKAATELYGDDIDKVKETVQNAINDPQGTAEKVKAAVQDAIDNAPQAAEKIKEVVAETIKSATEKSGKTK